MFLILKFLFLRKQNHRKNSLFLMLVSSFAFVHKKLCKLLSKHHFQHFPINPTGTL
ncbi:hypothetical protein LEP1GSC086_1131 [Leptospira weilii str. LNT 1234]|nr:hypothetical protein LEP1GSC086_1131 [Leptospira weilii str. LNT 1234]